MVNDMYVESICGIGGAGGFLHIGHVCLGEEWVGSLGDFKWDAEKSEESRQLSLSLCLWIASIRNNRCFPLRLEQRT